MHGTRREFQEILPLDVYIVHHPSQDLCQPRTWAVTDFMTELETLFSDITLSVVPAVIVGDFNIHYDDPSNSYIQRVN